MAAESSAQRKWTQLCREGKEDQKRGERRDRKRVVRRMWFAAVCLEKRGCGVGWVRTSAVLRVNLRSPGSVTA